MPIGQWRNMKFWCTTLGFLLLGALPWQVSAQTGTEAALRDLREHGYVSLSEGVARLQQNVPADDAPLAEREAYYRSLLDMAQRAGRYPEVMEASRGTLQRMADKEACTHCRFDLLLSQYRGSNDSRPSPDEAATLLDKAEALLPEIESVDAKRQLLAARSRQAASNGKLNQAIALAAQASDLARRSGNTASQLSILADLIGLNGDIGDSKRAVELGNEAYRLAEEIGYRALLGPISLDMGHAYSLLGDRERQRHVLERALAFSDNDPDQSDIRILALNNLSDYWLSQPDGYRKALGYAERAEALARTLGWPGSVIAPMANIGIAQAGLGRIDEGVAMLRKSIELANQYKNDVYAIGITQEMTRILKQAGRYREALEALESIASLQEERTRQERETAVLELQEKYSAERKADEIEKLAAQNRLKQSQLETEKWRQRMWVALALILGLLLILLQQTIRRVRQSNRKLANANASLALQSATDPLTGAFNRRHTQALLGNLQQGQKTEAAANAGLVLLDLDFFKRINDTRGHAAGDAVLVEVVHRLRARLRQNDVVSRWGGEEFVLVLPNTPPDALSVVAGNVLRIIGDAPVEFDGQTIPITVSLGAISFPGMPGQAWEAALGLADAALYLAKASGRNQAVCVQRIDVGPECGEADMAQMQADGRAELLVVKGPPQSLSEAANPC